MKNILRLILICAVFLFALSCEENSGIIPNIEEEILMPEEFIKSRVNVWIEDGRNELAEVDVASMTKTQDKLVLTLFYGRVLEDRVYTIEENGVGKTVERMSRNGRSYELIEASSEMRQGLEVYSMVLSIDKDPDRLLIIEHVPTN